MRRATAVLLAVMLLLGSLLAVTWIDGPADGIGGIGLEATQSAPPGLTFDDVSGTEWWVQTRLSGGWAGQVVVVEAKQSSGAWIPLVQQAWGPCDCWWAGTLHVQPGHDVRLRAHLLNGLVEESCWHGHPDGTALCELGLADVDWNEVLLVGFEEGRMPDLDVGERLAGLDIVGQVPQIDVLMMHGVDLPLVEAVLRFVPDIVFIEAEGRVEATGGPDDPRYSGQYGLAMAGFPAAWSRIGYGSAEVTVAVIDSGITASHPDLAGPRILPGHDYVEKDSVPDDDCGHGTHVTGVLGATTDNGMGVAGAAQAAILPLKALGSGCSGTLSDIAKAVTDAADQDADVITMSFGTSFDSPTLRKAVAYAWQAGSLLVASAGNTHGGDVRYPAAYAEVIAATALEENKGLAPYASHGTEVEVAAPGTRIDATTKNGGYGHMTGTSMAAPHVAGALALALSCAPGTNDQLRAALAASSEDLGPAGRDDQYGHGLLRVDRLVEARCDTSPGANAPPVAAFDATPSGLSVQFDGTRSSDADGDDLSYAWAFGDGAGSAAAAPRHSYRAGGTYAVTLTVSDGRLDDTHAIDVTVEQGAFQTIFSPADGSNEWWVEVGVTGDRPVHGVDVQVDDGAWRSLSHRWWGAWADSFFVAKGSEVVFRAHAGDGETAYSATYAWLGPPPQHGPFTAFFTPKTLENPWWVEVSVASNEPMQAVDVRFDGGSWTSLPHTAWGTWAKSIHVTTGTEVEFRATANSGEQASSQTFTWK